MKKSFKGGLAAGVAVASLAATGCEVAVKESPNELLRTVDDVASRHGLSVRGLLGLIGCESTFDQYANRGNAKSYKGYLQQGIQYFNGRYSTTTRRHPELNLPKDIYDTRTNLEISADMMGTYASIRKNWECESKYKCYSNPSQRRCLPKVVDVMLAQSDSVIVANRIVSLHPVIQIEQVPSQAQSVAAEAQQLMQQYAPDLAEIA